ncbi:ATP-binding protein [Rhizobacter sp. Root1221]|uniref:ATP-binding protein n=1 Tax=Rhizobacter sp. Root1221 TaxID=1736433 RepID=UPI0006FF43FA|nr:ATP-binding protein [Rhizobacter sp. Root1221]KQV91707.1 histidine kinase [Rhizobacter sp. Root1221]
MSLHRYSFRQLLLVAFLLIATLLSAASLRGLFTLEGLLRQSSAAARQAVALSAAAQLMAERSVDMERAARQFLVLGDPNLRQRFDDAAREAGVSLTQLSAGTLPQKTADAWRITLETIEAQLTGTPPTQRARDQALTAAFAELDQLNATIADQVRQAAEERNQVLRDELEARRVDLAQQILGAIGVAGVLALVFGLWLARPLKRIENAIVGLGENRLEKSIDIRGPADVRLIGQRLEWLRLRLAELDSDKARFLRHVSHELKTPLAALREGVSLLEDGVTGALNDNQVQVVRILQQNTVVLQRQIEDLLRFNAAAFEARRLVRRKTELVAFIGDLVNQQRLQWMAKLLRVQVDGEPLWTEIDGDKMGMALGNLLSNAIRFSPSGGTIQFSVSREAGRACIDIVDNGPGVASADRARVFEPFYRGERQPADAARGSGIGLSIVHEYVTAHGGQIELLPDEPGAHFHIELPHASSD